MSDLVYVFSQQLSMPQTTLISWLAAASFNAEQMYIIIFVSFCTILLLICLES